MHLFIKLLNNLPVLTTEESDRLIDECVIFFLCTKVDTRSDAPFDIVEDAGSRSVGKFLIRALTHGKNAMQEIESFSCSKGACVGPKILSIGFWLASISY